MPLNFVRSPDVGGLGGEGEGGLGGKGHHLSITYSWHPLLLLPVVINNNKNAIIQVMESYHGTRHLNSHMTTPCFPALFLSFSGCGVLSGCHKHM